MGVNYTSFVVNAALAQSFKAHFGEEVVASFGSLAALGITPAKVVPSFAPGSAISRRRSLLAVGDQVLLVTADIGPFADGVTRPEAESAVSQLALNASSFFSPLFKSALGVLARQRQPGRGRQHHRGGHWAGWSRIR